MMDWTNGLNNLYQNLKKTTKFATMQTPHRREVCI